jgi:histidine triad (HIT) family protein
VSDCVFCNRMAGLTRFNAQWMSRDGSVAAFCPLNPVVPGHTLVVPRVHVPDFLHLEASSGWGLLDACSRVGKQVRHEYDATGVNLITSAGEAATQSVFHLHMHIVPRRPGDGLLLPWSNQVRSS